MDNSLLVFAFLGSLFLSSLKKLSHIKIEVCALAAVLNRLILLVLNVRLISAGLCRLIIVIVSVETVI